jgi:hypothetical protein
VIVEERVGEAIVAEKGTRNLLSFVPSLYQVALLVVLGAILTLALAPRLEGDFWWHLIAGASIATHHAVPTHDFLSFTAAGHHWLDAEWLTELLMYGLYQLGGLWGPIVFFALVICASFALVYAVMATERVNKILALFVVMAAAVSSFASWGPRVQMMSLLFLALYGLLLTRFQIGRNRRLLVVFPVSMLFWVNLHSGFALGIVMLVIALAGGWLNRVTRHPDALSRDDLRALGVALVATVVVALVNPDGLSKLLYPLELALPNVFTNNIAEWASPNFHTSVMMVFEAMLLLLAGSALVARLRVNWTHLLVVLVFTHLALSQERNVAVWAVVVSPLVALYLQAAAQRLRELAPGVTYRRHPVRGSLAPVLNVTLLALSVIFYIAIASHYVTPAAARQDERQNFPARAVGYLQTHRLQPNLFATYFWGGYAAWRLSPRYKVFIDGRAETVYSARILNAYLSAYAAAPDWKQVLNRYRVDDVLVERSAPLAQVLAEDNGWVLRYRDPMAVLYVRR